jgi:hypothetical protein
MSSDELFFEKVAHIQEQIIQRMMRRGSGWNKEDAETE